MSKYYVYLIAKKPGFFRRLFKLRGKTSTVMSDNPVKPKLPKGYIFFSLIGEVRDNE